MHPRLFLPFLLLFCSLGLSVRADTVAEWKFDTDKQLAGGEIVKLDTFNPKASDISKLMQLSTVEPFETGLGDKWQPCLRKGYLVAPLSVGGKSQNQVGLRTETSSDADNNAEFRDYFGFSGLGRAEKGTGGTVYLVIKPNEGWEAPARRRTLFGTGHTIEGVIKVVVNEQKALTLTVGGVSDKGRHDAVTSSLDFPWENDKWYFIGASWQEGSMPLLYVREMSAEGGPLVSPPGMTAQADSVAPSATDSPKPDPLVIGAYWFNTGGEWYVTDGADACIAYARIENSYSTIDDMKSVFDSLGAP